MTERNKPTPTVTGHIQCFRCQYYSMAPEWMCLCKVTDIRSGKILFPFNLQRKWEVPPPPPPRMILFLADIRVERSVHLLHQLRKWPKVRRHWRRHRSLFLVPPPPLFLTKSFKKMKPLPMMDWKSNCLSGKTKIIVQSFNLFRRYLKVKKEVKLRHEDVLGEWRYSSMHSSSRH
jgi:hypothetical protein